MTTLYDSNTLGKQTSTKTKDTILVVDDHAAIVCYLQEYLSARNFNVHTAADGREAVELATKLHPDLVLLDIMLPVLDGFEVLEELKKREIPTRVIMFSAYFNDRDTAIKCIRNGACDFIEKPVRFDELVDRIKRYILTDKTLNMRIADTTPVVDKLIARVEILTTELENTEKENESLRSRNLRSDVLAKTVYVGLATICVSVLFGIGVVGSGLSLGLVFIMLVLLLMIPSDRIHKVSARLAKLKTVITLKHPE